MPKANFSPAVALMDQAIALAVHEYTDEPVTLVCTSFSGLAPIGISLYQGKNRVPFHCDQDAQAKAISTLIEARVLLSGEVLFNLGNSA